MKPGYQKYIPFQPQPIQGRTWPDRVITQAPSGVLWTCGTATRLWWTP